MSSKKQAKADSKRKAGPAKGAAKAAVRAKTSAKAAASKAGAAKSGTAKSGFSLKGLVRAVFGGKDAKAAPPKSAKQTSGKLPPSRTKAAKDTSKSPPKTG